METEYDPDGLACMRGFVYALPFSLLAWAAILAPFYL